MASPKKSNKPSGRILSLGDIDGESVNEIIEVIYEINEEDAKKTQKEPIKLIINSFGGELYSGLALVDVIDNSLTPVHTICHGSAMSMALVVYAAGHKRLASKYATFMYHEALNSYPQFDKLSIIKDDLDESNRVMKQYDEILLLNSTISQKQLDDVKKSRRDWYFTAEEAFKYGMVDEIE
jgi:ATP-dependent Clp protease protease subunit